MGADEEKKKNEEKKSEILTKDLGQQQIGIVRIMRRKGEIEPSQIQDVDQSEIRDQMDES